MLMPIEEKILKKIAQHQLIKKIDLVSYLSNNGAGGDTESIVESVTRALVNKKFISLVSPAGSVCYVITSKGTQALGDKI